MNYIKEKKLLIIVVICVLLSFIPFNTTVAPEWKIQVVDENGIPYKKQMVRQTCTDHALVTDCLEIISERYTDNNGYVVFPKRVVRLGLILRLFNSLYTGALALLGLERWDIEVNIYSSGKYDSQTLEYYPTIPLPDKLVLRSKPE